MPPDQRAIAGVDDSKRLDASRRVELALRIQERALAVSLGAASVHEIDRLNIYHATVLAMRRALSRLPARLGQAPAHILIDGTPLRTLGYVHTAIVKGDAKCYAIACASIIAKVTRDRLMGRLDARYPVYGWARNAGYGTVAHQTALGQHGLTPHHRRTFCLDEQVSLDLSASTSRPTDDRS